MQSLLAVTKAAFYYHIKHFLKVKCIISAPLVLLNGKKKKTLLLSDIGKICLPKNIVKVF